MKNLKTREEFLNEEKTYKTGSVRFTGKEKAADYTIYNDERSIVYSLSFRTGGLENYKGKGDHPDGNSTSFYLVWMSNGRTSGSCKLPANKKEIEGSMYSILPVLQNNNIDTTDYEALIRKSLEDFLKALEKVGWGK